MSETEIREDDAGATAGQDPEQRDKSPGRGPAWLALLLALAALGASAWLIWTHRLAPGADIEARVEARGERLDAALERQRSRVDEAASRAAEAERAAEEAARGLAGLRGRLEALESARRDGEGDLASLRRELESLDARFAQLAERYGDAQQPSPAVDLALADVELLISAAYRAAALDADAARAARALERADTQLAELALDGTEPARRELAREIEALRAVPGVDRDGLAGRLAALADGVSALPLAGAPTRAAPAPAGDDDGARSWWGAARSFLGRYFTVRRTDRAGAELPDPATLALAREVLRLELEQARAAVWSRDPERYRSALSRAAALLERYFDARAEAVARFRERLTELDAAAVAPALPETGTALEAVRALRARRAGAG